MSSGPGFQQQQQAYAQAVGTSSTARNVLRDRNPTANDVQYQIGTFWQNTTLGNLFYLNSFTSTSALLQAVWYNIGTAGIPIDSLEPDTGTNPVIANASGLVAVKGQSTPNVSGIQVTGALNELDIAMFSPFKGDFTFTDAASGSAETLTVSNTSNTASSDASLVVSVGGTSGGDPYINLSVAASTQWAVGTDNSDSDTFKVSQNATLGTNDKFEITTAGAITFNNAYTFPTADGLTGQSLVTDGAGQLSFSSNSALYAVTSVNASPYVVLATDEFLSVNTTIAITIQLPNTTDKGRVVIIKDATGNAAANNITVTTVGGVVNIDGSPTYTIIANYNSASFLFDSVAYEVF